MKQQNKRLSILLDSEIQELYSRLALPLEQQRLYFVLNDLGMEVYASLRGRHVKAYFIILLGYIKAKPIVLNFIFSDIKEDFYFALENICPVHL